MDLQSDCRSAQSAGLESAAADVPAATAVDTRLPDAGSSDPGKLVPRGVAGALTEPRVSGTGIAG